MFLKSYGRPFLGLTASNVSHSQVSASAQSGELSADVQKDALSNGAESEGTELVEKDTRDRFKRMCEVYFETISKKLVKEHLVGNICTEVGPR